MTSNKTKNIKTKSVKKSDTDTQTNDAQTSNTNTSTISDQEAQARAAMRNQEVLHLNLGYILGLFSSSQLHSRVPVGQFMAGVLPAIQTNQYKLFLQNNKPVGYVSWAKLSKEVSEKYQQGNYFLKPQDWNSGTELWLADFVVPYSNENRAEVIQNLKEKIFVNQEILIAVRNKEGKVDRIIKNFENPTS